MATHRVDDLLLLINQQVKIQEDSYECLAKISAMIEVVQGDGFLNQAPSTIYHYFWMLSDGIKQACSLNEQSLNALIENLEEEDL